MTLRLKTHRELSALWPSSGRHVLAQFDDETIVVYQAYRPSIGRFAAEHNFFGGDFSFGRMSWIKPNFLWMMFRSGWGQKPGQEVVLAVTLSRDFFEEVLAAAVYSSFAEEIYKSRADWQEQLKASEVRLQWDPDHSPRGGKLERRAIQLGLRGEFLRRYATEAVVKIDDISELVREGWRSLEAGDELMLPAEAVYMPRESAVAAHLGLAAAEA